MSSVMKYLKAMHNPLLCEEVFAKYPLSDDFLYEPAFDNLYTEITGTILIWLDEYGIQ